MEEQKLSRREKQKRRKLSTNQRHKKNVAKMKQSAVAGLLPEQPKHYYYKARDVQRMSDFHKKQAAVRRQHAVGVQTTAFIGPSAYPPLTQQPLHRPTDAAAVAVSPFGPAAQLPVTRTDAITPSDATTPRVAVEATVDEFAVAAQESAVTRDPLDWEAYQPYQLPGRTPPTSRSPLAITPPHRFAPYGYRSTAAEEGGGTRA